MPKASPILTSFNAGELSPRLAGRVDLAKYPNGCAYLENYLPTVQGPLVRRAGTRFVAEVKSSASGKIWMLRFEFNTTQAYQLEFGDKYIRFYANRGQVIVSGVAAYNAGTAYGIGDLCSNGGVNYYCIAATTGNSPPNSTYWYALTGSVYEIPSPFAIADLTNSDGTLALSIVQSGDVIYFAHPKYAQQKLSRYGSTKWVFSTVNFEAGPFNPVNSDGVTAVYASANTSAGTTPIQLTANAAIWQAGHVESLFYLGEKDVRSIVQWEAGKAYAANALVRSDGKNYKAVNAATSGGVKPTHTSGAVYDGTTGVQWTYLDRGFGNCTIKSLDSTAAKAITGAANNGSGLIRITSTAHGFNNGDYLTVASVTGTTEANGNWIISGVAANTYDLVGSAFVHAYVSGGTGSWVVGSRVNVLVNERIPDNAVGATNPTLNWAQGLWNGVNGYASLVTFFRERLVWATSRRINMSVAGDYENYNIKDGSGNVVADMAISIEVVSREVNNIRWIDPGQDLLIGTAGGEFICRELTKNQVFGPGNVTIVPQSEYGSSQLRPNRVGFSLVYVQRSGQKVREMAYDFGPDNYKSTDVTVLAEHVTKGGVLNSAYQQEPFSIIWYARADGELIGFTFNREQDVVGWHRHPLGGAGVVECVSSCPSPDGSRNDLWMIVKRTINGTTKRYIEYLEAEHQVGDDPELDFYVDCALSYDGKVNSTLTPGAGATTAHATGIAFVAGSASWSAGDVGREIHYRYPVSETDNSGKDFIGYLTAKAKITAYTDSTHVTCTINAAFPSTTAIAANGWRMTATTISGLSHLEGQTVDVLANGAPHPQVVVTSGSISLKYPSSVAHIGMPCPAKFQTMRLKDGAADGTSQGKTARINKVAVRLLESMGIKFGMSFTGMDEYSFRSSLDAMDTATPLFTGDIVLDWPGDYDTNPWLCFMNDLPLPSTIVAIMPQVNVQDR